MTPPATGPTTHALAKRPASSRRQGPRGAPAPELDHRVANSLQLAVDFLIFQQARLTDPIARKALIESAERLVAVGHLHRFLCAHDGEREVDLKPFLEALAGLMGQSTGLNCTTDVEALQVSASIAQQLGLLVNELAINAAKHAYPMGEAGDLSIQAWRERDELRLVVADRGAGLPAGFDPAAGEGLGLDIVRRIAAQLNGVLRAETDSGARFTLTMPLQAPARPVRSFAPPV